MKSVFLRRLLLFVLPLGIIGAGGQCLGAPPANSGVSPNSGNYVPGVKYTFSSSYADLDGSQNIKSAYFLVNASPDGNGGVYLWYDAANNKIYLSNDANTGWLGGVAPGTLATIQNSRAAIAVADTSVATSLYYMTINWAITFTSATQGRVQKLWSYVEDKQSASAGWDESGAILITGIPRNMTLTPVFGTLQANVTTTMRSVYFDQGGQQTITNAYFQLKPLVGSSNNFQVRYDNTTNLVYLRNDADSNWGAGAVLGGASVLENSSGKVYASDMTIVRKGQFLEVNWRVSFKDPLAGQTVGAWMKVENDRSQTSIWDNRGQYSIKGLPAVLTNVSLVPEGVGVYLNTPTTLIAKWRDPAGKSHLTGTYLLINTDAAIPGDEGVVTANSFKNAAMVFYEPKTNRLWLRNDADTAWLGGAAPGSNTIIQNSKATINFGASSVASTSTDLTLTLQITFSAANRETMNKAMMQATNDLGMTTGWQKMRQYYILDAPPPPPT